MSKAKKPKAKKSVSIKIKVQGKVMPIFPYVTTIDIDGVMHEQRYYEPMRPYDVRKTKKIKLIAIDQENRILCIRDQKTGSLDVMNGARVSGDKTLEDVAHRVALKEGAITINIDAIKIAAVIETNPIDAPEQIAGTLVMATYIEAIGNCAPPSREFLSKEVLLKQLDADKAKDMTQLIAMAEFVLPQRPIDHMPYIMQHL